MRLEHEMPSGGARARRAEGHRANPSSPTTSASFQKNGRQGTSAESPLMPT